MQPAEVIREKQLNTRWSEEESRRLDALAAHYGLTASSVIRMLVKRDADALGIAAEPPKPATKTKKPAK